MTHAFHCRPYLMANPIQPYAWGARGRDAFIPRLLGTEAEEGRAYAELWMGTHPNAPSDVVVDGTPLPLAHLIAAHRQETLGPVVSDRFEGALPFLLKVLSAAEPLSIQVHPSREQAVRLHACDPQHYPDANHKPEVAIALDGLTALAGFKTYGGIARALRNYPELSGVVGPQVSALFADAALPSPGAQRDHVRRLYAALAACALQDEGELARALERLTDRLTCANTAGEEGTFFLELRRFYPGADIGLFLALLLNRIRLGPGQGIFIPAGVPHAYLSGNIVECMAASDNVVRAGLTPKFKDLAVLEEILSYDLGPLPVIDPPMGAADAVYRTPAAEFEVSRRRLRCGAETGMRSGGPQILLLTAGEAHLRWSGGELGLRRGQSVFVPACLGGYSMQAEDDAEVFCAGVPGEADPS